MKFSLSAALLTVPLLALMTVVVDGSRGRLSRGNRGDDSHERRRRAMSKGKGGSCGGCSCDGYEHYRYIKAEDALPDGRVTWDFFEAMDATPKNCILAPVTCPEDLVAIDNAFDLFKVTSDSRVWVGVYKPSEDLTNDGPPASYENWFTLEGTELPDDPTEAALLWNTNNPNNDASGGSETHAFVSAGTNPTAQLISTRPTTKGDPNNDTGRLGALYKCCTEHSCPANSMIW